MPYTIHEVKLRGEHGDGHVIYDDAENTGISPEQKSVLSIWASEATHSCTMEKAKQARTSASSLVLPLIGRWLMMFTACPLGGARALSLPSVAASIVRRQASPPSEICRAIRRPHRSANASQVSDWPPAAFHSPRSEGEGEGGVGRGLLQRMFNCATTDVSQSVNRSSVHFSWIYTTHKRRRST